MAETKSNAFQSGGSVAAIMEWLRDKLLKILIGRERAELLLDNRALAQRTASLEYVARKAYLVGANAIARYQRELEAKELAMQVLELKLAKMETLSHIDPLTGLLNRRGATEQLIAEASAVWRSIGSTKQAISKQLLPPYSVVFIDLDEFKPINDQFGHAKGDDALRTVARLLHECFPRKDDIIVRLGGDEFVVIMTNADIRIAEKRSDTLLRKMAKDDALLFGQTRICASIGISSMILAPTKGGLDSDSVRAKLEQAIKEADGAMYLSKETGKGRVTVYSHGG